MFVLGPTMDQALLLGARPIPGARGLSLNACSPQTPGITIVSRWLQVDISVLNPGTFLDEFSTFLHSFLQIWNC